MSQTGPSLEHLWGTFIGYQHTAAMKAAIELDVFTHIAAGATTLDALARRTGAVPRGLQALVNFLVADGFLTKDGERYGLGVTAAALLDRNAPTYLGSAVAFIASSHIVDAFNRLTEAVRRGGTAVPEEGMLAPEHPGWVTFARAMAPLAAMSGMLLGNLLDIGRAAVGKVLDVSAGHGMFGIALAQANPRLTVTALDWANVLAVAEENARAAGVADRFHLLPGSAFDADFGDGYDLVLLPNFLHHFDPAGCERILAKARAALAPGGRVVIVEFVPNEDRVTPPDAARFALVMLATTPGGDAYTFAEYEAMLKRTGYTGVSVHELVPTPARVVIASR